MKTFPYRNAGDAADILAYNDANPCNFIRIAPFNLGDQDITNRVLLGPLKERCRDNGGAPHEITTMDNHGNSYVHRCMSRNSDGDGCITPARRSEELRRLIAMPTSPYSALQERAAAIEAFWSKQENRGAREYIKDNLPVELVAKYGADGGADRCFNLGIKEACNDMSKFIFSTPYFETSALTTPASNYRWLYVSLAGVAAFWAYRYFTRGK